MRPISSPGSRALMASSWRRVSMAQTRRMRQKAEAISSTTLSSTSSAGR
jgi:hypothetical protein